MQLKLPANTINQWLLFQNLQLIPKNCQLICPMILQQVMPVQAKSQHQTRSIVSITRLSLSQDNPFLLQNIKLLNMLTEMLNPNLRVDQVLILITTLELDNQEQVQHGQHQSQMMTLLMSREQLKIMLKKLRLEKMREINPRLKEIRKTHPPLKVEMIRKRLLLKQRFNFTKLYSIRKMLPI